MICAQLWPWRCASSARFGLAWRGYLWCWRRVSSREWGYGHGKSGGVCLFTRKERKHVPSRFDWSARVSCAPPIRVDGDIGRHVAVCLRHLTSGCEVHLQLHLPLLLTSNHVPDRFAQNRGHRSAPRRERQRCADRSQLQSRAQCLARAGCGPARAS
jgi:hypothetical protein